MKKCPFCAEQIQDEAIKCRFCGESLAGYPTQSTKWYHKKYIFIPAIFIIGPLAIRMIWSNPNISKTAKLWLSITVIILFCAILLLLFFTIRNIYSGDFMKDLENI